MGYGVVKGVGKRIELLHLDVVKLTKLQDPMLKLKAIFEAICEVIDRFHPDELAVEAPFFGKNVQSMLKLGRAQGVIMAASMHRNLPITEYSPRKVKQAITGQGAASKEQVAAMLQNICGHTEQPRYLDATDGLAVAVCHLLQFDLKALAPEDGKSKLKLPKKKKSSWDEFLRNNPDRKL